MARTSKKGLLSSSRPTHRTSKYRGVTRHRLTGRFEAHLWDKGCWNVNLGKKGKQVYLGAYDQEKEAAKAHDLAALKYWGISATILNFPLASYKKDLEEMMGFTKEEYLASLRRKSSGFSRGVSKYRGVARHHQNGRWEARIGRVMGNKYLYLGTFDTQEEAAAAYDRAAILHRGLSAVTNFDISLYTSEIKQAKESVKPPSPQPQPVLDESINNITKSASNSMSNECTDVNNANDEEFCVHSSQDLGMLVDCTTFINFSSIEGMEALFNFSSHEEHGSSSSCIAIEPSSSCIAIEPSSSCIAIEPSSPLPSFHEVEGIDGEDSFLVANPTNTII